MKVECINVVNELEPSEPPPPAQKERLTIGKCYDVLEVSFSHTAGMCWYRIECDDGKPWLILSTQFKIICGRIPGSWVASGYRGGITFSPESWCADDFWEKLFRGEALARQILEQEKQKMAAG